MIITFFPVYYTASGTIFLSIILSVTVRIRGWRLPQSSWRSWNSRSPNNSSGRKLGTCGVPCLGWNPNYLIQHKQFWLYSHVLLLLWSFLHTFGNSASHTGTVHQAVAMSLRRHWMRPTCPACARPTELRWTCCGASWNWLAGTTLSCPNPKASNIIISKCSCERKSGNFEVFPFCSARTPLPCPRCSKGHLDPKVKASICWETYNILQHLVWTCRVRSFTSSEHPHCCFHWNSLVFQYEA